MLRGIVERVNWQSNGRTDGTVDVALPNGAVVPAAYVTPWPPIPRTSVWVEEALPGAWVVIGAEGGGLPILHDDFAGGQATTTPGDTDWTTFTSGTTTQGFVPTVAGSASHGVYRATVTAANATSYRGITKSGKQSLDEDSTVYIAARICSQSVVAGAKQWVALSEDQLNGTTADIDNQGVAIILTDDDATANLYVSSDGVTGYDYLGEISQLTFDVFEVLIVPGSFVAAWMNGVGPVISQVYLLDDSAQSSFLNVGTTSGSAASSGVYIDWIHVERPGIVVPPQGRAPALTYGDEELAVTDYGLDATVIGPTDDEQLGSEVNDPADLAAGDDF